jgi:Tol biopolymer transport system component
MLIRNVLLLMAAAPVALSIRIVEQNFTGLAIGVRAPILASQGLTKCPKCKKAVKATWKFCDKCGATLKAVVPKPTPKPTVPTAAIAIPFANHPTVDLIGPSQPVPANNILTTGADVLRSLGIDRNGSTIVFGSNKYDTTDVLKLELSGKGGPAESRLTSEKAAEYDPDISPDGDEVVYVSEGLSGDPQLKIVSIFGGAARSLLVMKGYLWQPRWSPDGKRIVFVSKQLERGPGDLYVINADGTNLFALATTPGDESSPSWCPKGCHIAFEGQRGLSAPQIFAKSSTGPGPETQITKGSNASRRPCWGPKYRIAYESDVFGTVDIFSINENGLDRQRLTDLASNESYARYSGDGTKLAFLVRTPSGLEIAWIDSPQ